MRLRIISGIYKGRFINVPDSKFIRPTTDRVRETLFNLLYNQIDFEDIQVLDIYAGSGSLGLECLSRGAGNVHFIEQNFKIFKNLESNIKSLDAQDNCKIYNMEAIRYSQLKLENTYDLILLDPPFFKDDVYDVVKNLVKNNFLKEDGMIVIERSIQTKSKDIENFYCEPFKVIGDTCLYKILSKKNAVE